MIKRSLCIFNPDNDLALANGEVNYMPPASARRMAEELAMLPIWYAAPESAVLAPSAYNQAFLCEMQERVPLPVELMTEPEIALEPNMEILPWGWNPALRKRLQVLGISENSLPSLSCLEGLRKLSHRRQAVELLPYLQLGAHFCGESSFLVQAEEYRQYVEAHEICLLKAPLSGSGKGLNWCKGVFTSFISGWCNRVATLQGGVVAEPVYDKVLDFAMEFHSDGKGRLSFVGYSMFSTNSSGAYEGNLLLSDEEIESRLSGYVPLECFLQLRMVLERELVARFGTVYSGYLGIDMMICRFPASEMEYRIHPCVEINLRMNMGVVSHTLYERYVTPGSTGRFLITYHPTEGDALQAHEQMTVDYPLKIENGKVLSGYMPLVPVTRRNLYRAWMIVD